jgi:teichuronic acid biosynthesis glycosyltransferase TuaG
MTYSSPKVTIITPAYNAEHFLRETVGSVAAQTFVDFEHIIVDDCSTDATARIIAQACADPRVRGVRTERNGGVAAARNLGLESARGSLICFLDADDRWTPDKLERQVSFMCATGVGCSYMDYQRTDLAGKPLGIVAPPATIELSELLKSNFIGNLTAMATKAAIGGTRFRRIGHEDYVFWLEVVRRVGQARKVPTSQPPACLYRVTGTSLSANKLRAAAWQWNIYREVAGLDLVRSAWFFSNYVVKGVLKRV